MRIIAILLFAFCTGAGAAKAGPVFDQIQAAYDQGVMPDLPPLSAKGVWAGKLVTTLDTEGGAAFGTFPISDPMGNQLYASLDESTEPRAFIDMNPTAATVEYGAMQHRLDTNPTSALEPLTDATHHELTWTEGSGTVGLSLRTGTATDGTKLMIVRAVCEALQGCVTTTASAPYTGVLYIGYYWVKIL